MGNGSSPVNGSGLRAGWIPPPAAASIVSPTAAVVSPALQPNPATIVYVTAMPSSAQTAVVPFQTADVGRALPPQLTNVSSDTAQAAVAGDPEIAQIAARVEEAGLTLVNASRGVIFPGVFTGAFAGLTIAAVLGALMGVKHHTYIGNDWVPVFSFSFPQLALLVSTAVFGGAIGGSLVTKATQGIESSEGGRTAFRTAVDHAFATVMRLAPQRAAGEVALTANGAPQSAMRQVHGEILMYAAHEQVVYRRYTKAADRFAKACEAFATARDGEGVELSGFWWILARLEAQQFTAQDIVEVREVLEEQRNFKAGFRFRILELYARVVLGKEDVDIPHFVRRLARDIAGGAQWRSGLSGEIQSLVQHFDALIKREGGEGIAATPFAQLPGKLVEWQVGVELDGAFTKDGQLA